MNQNAVALDIQNFDEAVRYLKRNNLAIPQVYSFDLTTARDDEAFGVTGNFFYVLDSTDTTDSITVKFNQKDIIGVPLSKQLGLRTPFDKVYISHTAQSAKTMTIVVGTVSQQFLDIIDNRSNIDADLAALLEYTQGDTAPENGGARVQLSAEGEILAANADRKGAFVHNPASNGVLYLRLGTGTVTTTNYMVALQAGDSFSIDTYRGSIRGLMASTGQFAHFGEW